ncbi:MAG: hypothetical protein NDI62_02180 [Burkholderiales bacterium]|nr:hypothetical protein [Burkholderiales bacterium]
MLETGLVLFWDTIKDPRFFLEMRFGEFFNFTVHESFDMKECQKRVNKKFKEEEKNFFIKITRNTKKREVFKVECFSLSKSNK